MKDISLKKYFRQFKIDSLSELTLNQANNFFSNIIKDFKEYKISLDDLAFLGSFTFHHFAKKQKNETDLFVVSLAAAELSFAVRQQAVYENIIFYLTDIDNFYKKYPPTNQDSSC
jgi:hypothetical protein